MAPPNCNSDSAQYVLQTLSMFLQSLASFLHLELTPCLRQPNNRHSSQQGQAALLLGVGSQFDNPKTCGTFEKDKNTAIISMSQALQVGALKQAEGP
jgi:hypothetical protein